MFGQFMATKRRVSACLSSDEPAMTPSPLVGPVKPRLNHALGVATNLSGIRLFTGDASESKYPSAFAGAEPIKQVWDGLRSHADDLKVRGMMIVGRRQSKVCFVPFVRQCREFLLGTLECERLPADDCVSDWRRLMKGVGSHNLPFVIRQQSIIIAAPRLDHDRSRQQAARCHTGSQLKSLSFELLHHQPLRLQFLTL
jgi:hypothetical protein